MEKLLNQRIRFWLHSDAVPRSGVFQGFDASGSEARIDGTLISLKMIERFEPFDAPTSVAPAPEAPAPVPPPPPVPFSESPKEKRRREHGGKAPGVWSAAVVAAEDEYAKPEA